MKNNITNLLVSGKAVTILRFALVLSILVTLLLFPSFAFAGPIPGGAGS